MYFYIYIYQYVRVYVCIYTYRYNKQIPSRKTVPEVTHFFHKDDKAPLHPSPPLPTTKKNTPWKINGWNLQPSTMKRKENDLKQTSMRTCSSRSSSRGASFPPFQETFPRPEPTPPGRTNHNDSEVNSRWSHDLVRWPRNSTLSASLRLGRFPLPHHSPGFP